VRKALVWAIFATMELAGTDSVQAKPSGGKSSVVEPSIAGVTSRFSRRALKALENDRIEVSLRRGQPCFDAR
jgi:hypothetical protein